MKLWRIAPLDTHHAGFCYDEEVKKAADKWIVGIDEVGRGPLAGPVMVCGVLMKTAQYEKSLWKGLTDSKKMTEKAREAWYQEALALKSSGKISFHTAARTAKEIDTRGIAVCIRECLTEIFETLSPDPRKTLVLLDGGLKAPKEYLEQQTIIKGDLSEKIISLASVIAKVTRDRYMREQHKKYPAFSWDQNKGYGTKLHRFAIKKEGISPLHRQSFLTRIIIDKK